MTGGDPGRRQPRPWDPRSFTRFWRILLAIVAVGFAVRIAYVVFAKLDEAPAGDQVFYNAAADRLGRHGEFLEPFDPHPPPLVGSDPAADHPPLTIIVLAPVSFLTDDSTDADRFTMAVFGTVTVLVLGLLGREIGGERAGWFAAGIAAVYPNLWVNDGLIMSETLAALAVTLALLSAYRFRRRPAVGTAAALGALCALAALARAELVLLLPLLALPVTVLVPWRRGALAWRPVVAAFGIAALLIGPWVVFNLARFEEPTFLSTNDGIALLGSNCDSVYSGSDIGLTDLTCLGGNPQGDQSVDSKLYRDRAFEYIGDHTGRAVIVAFARVGRTWSVFRPFDMLEYNTGEGRERWVTALGLVAFYPLLALAVYGGVVTYRRRVALWPLLVPVVIVTIASAVTYGQTRFRVPAEPSVVVLGAVGLGALASRPQTRPA
ncbi:MAG TPA: glycosyltransferase family 39 protein [Acidimicrobiia bacterium]